VPGRTTGSLVESLAIARERHGNRLHLIVFGMLDATTAHILRRECARACPANIDVVLLDVAHVNSLDDAGLEALFAAYERFGERLALIVGPPCAHLIHLNGSRERLPIIEG